VIPKLLDPESSNIFKLFKLEEEKINVFDPTVEFYDPKKFEYRSRNKTSH
jgi:hypothetical protein